MRTFFVPLFAIPSRQVLLVLFAIAIWFLLISWEYVVSLSMFGMVGLALFQWYPEKLRWGWRQTLPQALRRLRSDPSWFAAAIPFFLVLFTAIYSSDGDYTLNRLQVKIPFLVLTFAFAGLPVGEKRTYFQLHYLLLVLMCMAAVPVVVEYVSDPSLYNDLLRQGRHLPTPSNHIRFSMVGALAFCSGLYLYQQRFVWRNQKERILQVVMLIFLFGFLHLLAVRSGLLVLYVGILFSLARYIFLSRQWIRGGLLVFLLAATPVVAYFAVPAFHAKVRYMMWDIHQMTQGKDIDNSDSNRIRSMQIGWQIFRENPVLGIGIGDLRNEMEIRYQEQAPQFKSLIPHNQWLYILAGSGLLGLLVFAWAFFYPIFYKQRYRNDLLVLLLLIYFITYWFEPTIENNFGISILLLFLLPGLRQGERTDDSNNIAARPVS